eukprot:TRINITY_DN67826_c0_g4_i2.p2 TRINITY_DN67826_c0_g4~~TRINITY_DN67826_c0_g4_i2.p2  ORF type:complete len:195 (-),score=41.93 TRINITY_DN67826_c0_g4_i2:970-1554(-)
MLPDSFAPGQYGQAPITTHTNNPAYQQQHFNQQPMGSSIQTSNYQAPQYHPQQPLTNQNLLHTHAAPAQPQQFVHTQGSNEFEFNTTNNTTTHPHYAHAHPQHGQSVMTTNHPYPNHTQQPTALQPQQAAPTLNIKALQAEKRVLKKKLCDYQREFRQQNDREVSNKKDREPMNSEYERYKELKNLLKSLDGGK